MDPILFIHCRALCPFTLEPLELPRHRSSGARISDALKGTKTCRSFKNRSHRLGATPNPSRLTRRDLTIAPAGGSERCSGSRWWWGRRKCLGDRDHRRLGRSGSRYDRGRRFGDRHVVRCDRGALLRSGIPPAELFASVLSPPVQPAGQNRRPPPALPMATVFERMRAISAAATSAADLQRAMGAFGLECTPYSGPRRDSTAPWSLPGCLAMNGRPGR